ncbi:hypothetical protein MRX96_045312 [Rhipicephalus microplus]
MDRTRYGHTVSIAKVFIDKDAEDANSTSRKNATWLGACIASTRPPCMRMPLHDDALWKRGSMRPSETIDGLRTHDRCWGRAIRNMRAL